MYVLTLDWRYTCVYSKYNILWTSKIFLFRLLHLCFCVRRVWVNIFCILYQYEFCQCRHSSKGVKYNMMQTSLRIKSWIFNRVYNILRTSNIFLFLPLHLRVCVKRTCWECVKFRCLHTYLDQIICTPSSSNINEWPGVHLNMSLGLSLISWILAHFTICYLDVFSVH